MRKLAETSYEGIEENTKYDLKKKIYMIIAYT